MKPLDSIFDYALVLGIVVWAGPLPAIGLLYLTGYLP